MGTSCLVSNIFQMRFVILFTQISQTNLFSQIILEKRLGIAQLCLMLAVLVFMGLTRGSRGEPLIVHSQRTMREWGKRHLSFSGDWKTRFGRGRNGTRSSPDAPRTFTEEGEPFHFTLQFLRLTCSVRHQSRIPISKERQSDERTIKNE